MPLEAEGKGACAWPLYGQLPGARSGVGKSGERIWKGKWFPGQYAAALCLTEDSVVIVAEGF